MQLRSPSLLTLLFLFLLGASVGAPGALADDRAGDGVLLRQGVVADPVGSVFYVMTTAGPIVALDALSGNERWSGPHGEPLGLQGDQLIALAEPTTPRQVDVAFLDAGTGAVQATVRFELPAGTSVLIDDLPHRRFEAAVAFTGDDVYLHWSYSGRPLRGALLDDAEADIVELSGVVRLDPASGTAQMVEGPNAPARAQFVPDLTDAERLPQLEGRQFRSADNRHVLASRRVADAGQWQRYRWSVADQTTGEILGDLRRPNSMASFVVFGNTAVHVAQPHARRLSSGDFEAKMLRLEALDLLSGSSLWAAEIRDTTFRGALPP